MPRRSEPAPTGDVADVAEVDAVLDDAGSALRWGSPDELADAVTRSHLADLSCVGWYGPVPAGWTLVIDAEDGDATPPPPLAARFGVDGFWERWTRAECLCKLADVPMLAWWPEHGLDVPAGSPVRYVTLRIGFDRPGGVIVTVACHPRTDADGTRGSETPAS